MTPPTGGAGPPARYAPAGTDEALGTGPVACAGLEASLRDTSAALRRLAGQRRGRQLGAVLTSWYTAALTVAVAVAVLVGAGQALRDLPGAPRGAAAGGIATAVTLLGAGTVLGIAVRLGPVGVPRELLRWALPLPADRGPLLLRTATTAVLAGGLALGGCAAVVLLVLAGAGVLPDPVRTLALGTAAGAVGGAALTGGAVLAQAVDAARRPPPGAGRVAAGVAVAADVGALAAVGLLVLQARGAADGPLPLGSPPSSVTAATVLAGLVLLTTAAVVGARTLGTADLWRPSAVRAFATGSVLSLDTRDLGRALAVPVRTRRRRSRGLSLVTRPWLVLVAADLLLLARQPRRAATAGGLGVAAVALAPLVGPVLAASLVLGAAWATATVLCQGRREARVCPELDRLVPLPARQVDALTLVVPGGLVAAWTAAVVPAAASALGRPVPASLVLLAALAGAAAACAGVRGASRADADFSVEAVDNGLGPVPWPTVVALVRGPDLAVVATLPLFLAVRDGAAGPGLLLVQALATGAAVLVAVFDRYRSGAAAPV